LTLVAAVVLGGLAVGAATSGTVRHQLLLSFSRQPDNFAELYFPAPGKLPTSFVAGRPLTVTFGLSNDSPERHAYGYVVTAGGRGGRSTKEGSGLLPVRAGGSVTSQLRLALPADTTSLTISLTGQPVLIRLLLHPRTDHVN
jgi:hypothetical protein